MNFEEIIKKLEELGKEKDELELWIKIFPNLNQGEKNQLIESLEKELRWLEKSSM